MFFIVVFPFWFSAGSLHGRCFMRFANAVIAIVSRGAMVRLLPC
jgi:hypothetical protein